ncbi:MAG: hypothetical protein ABH952_10745 [Candidatus Omnitrophota bacterium]|jgi:ferritin
MTNMDIKKEFEDEYCVLKAEIALEQFVQVKIINDIIKEETDPEQKALLQELLKEEKEEFTRAKAQLDECMIVNSNSYNNHKKT